MTPCPVCGGNCCRDGNNYSYKIKHMGAESYTHVCDFCDDGDPYPASLPVDKFDKSYYAYRAGQRDYHRRLIEYAEDCGASIIEDAANDVMDAIESEANKQAEGLEE